MLSEYYLVIKSIHVHAAGLSILLFIGRGLWSFWRMQDLRKRWIRILPHIVDTVLLVAAITLAVLSTQYPVKDGWLTAKLIALIVYIGLGAVALKPGRPTPVRATAFVAAVLTFGYIVAVAVTRSAWPFS